MWPFNSVFGPFNVLRTYCIIVSGRSCVFIYININMEQLKKCHSDNNLVFLGLILFD